MDTNINDIWDLPLESNPVINPDREGPTSSPRASNPPLFLPSDDEDEDASPNANANARNDTNNNNNNPDIDALFEGLDDIDDSFQELAPALDLDALRREADARNARAVRAELGTTNIPAAEPSTKTKTNGGRGGGGGGGVLDGLDGEGDGEDDGKKKRKPLPKLDETRLLGKDGFPQLLKDTKNFKPKGKGHEVIIIIIIYFSTLPLAPVLTADVLTDATCPSLRQWTWIACSKFTNSGPTNCTPKLDSKRR
jgi:replication fork protection complex subunit Csm3/Swi3